MQVFGYSRAVPAFIRWIVAIVAGYILSGLIGAAGLLAAMLMLRADNPDQDFYARIEDEIVIVICVVIISMCFWLVGLKILD